MSIAPATQRSLRSGGAKCLNLLDIIGGSHLSGPMRAHEDRESDALAGLALPALALSSPSSFCASRNPLSDAPSLHSCELNKI
jgi:hypothetical protein